MKKFKKVVLVFTLMLSSLAYIPISETQKASAATITDCRNDPKCASFVPWELTVNRYLDLYGYTKVEIKSGSSYVKLEDGVRIKGIKVGGEAVVYAYDSVGNYVMYSIYVRNTIFG